MALAVAETGGVMQTLVSVPLIMLAMVFWHPQRCRHRLRSLARTTTRDRGTATVVHREPTT